MNHSIISQPVEPINLLVFLWPDCGQQDLPVTLVRNGATRRMDAHGQSVFNRQTQASVLLIAASWISEPSWGHRCWDGPIEEDEYEMR